MSRTRALRPASGARLGETLAEAAVHETREEAGIVVEAGPVVHVSERIDAVMHDVFTVVRAEFRSGELMAGRRNEDVSQAAWVTVDEASALMPWYPDGVANLLAAAGDGYSAARA